MWAQDSCDFGQGKKLMKQLKTCFVACVVMLPTNLVWAQTAPSVSPSRPQVVGSPSGPARGPVVREPETPQPPSPFDIGALVQQRSPITLETPRVNSRRVTRGLSAANRFEPNCNKVADGVFLITSAMGALNQNGYLVLAGQCLTPRPMAFRAIKLADATNIPFADFVTPNLVLPGITETSEFVAGSRLAPIAQLFSMNTINMSVFDLSGSNGVLLFMREIAEGSPIYTIVLTQADTATLRAGKAVTRSSSPFPL